MKLSILVLTIIVFVQGAFAQNPQVPAKMEFAGLQLSITKSARHKIQNEVDKLRKSPAYFQRYVDKPICISLSLKRPFVKRAALLISST